MGRKITWGICCIQYHLRIRKNIGRETSKELKNHCNNGTTAFWKNEEALANYFSLTFLNLSPFLCSERARGRKNNVFFDYFCSDKKC